MTKSTSITSSSSSPQSVVRPPLNLLNFTQTRTFASKKHKKVLRLSKGFRGGGSKIYSVAIERLEKAQQYAYRDRKVKKRMFRTLWIQRLNASVRMHGLSYSRFVNMELRSDVILNRKVLAEMAQYEPLSFKAVMDVVKLRGTGGEPESGVGYPRKGEMHTYKADGSIDRRGF
jgi:large subunit ribosomal protein L20